MSWEALEVDDRVRLIDHRNVWWHVTAVSPNYAALTRQTAFEPKGVLEYTVLDWRKGIRGPCNLIGQGYGDGTYSREQCAEMLLDFEYVPEEDPAYIEAMERGEKSWYPTRDGLDVSARNNVPIEILEVITAVEAR